MTDYINLIAYRNYRVLFTKDSLPFANRLPNDIKRYSGCRYRILEYIPNLVFNENIEIRMPWLGEELVAYDFELIHNNHVYYWDMVHSH